MPHRIAIGLIGVGAGMLAVETIVSTMAASKAAEANPNPTPEQIVAATPGWYQSSFIALSNVWPLPISLELTLILVGAGILVAAKLR